MTHNFLNGVLTLKDANGNIAVYPHHPEELRPWKSEQEALDYVKDKKIYFMPPPTVDNLKPQKLFEINQHFDMEMKKIISSYPEMEVQSWSIQEKEARAWADYLVAKKSNKSLSAPTTPMLDSLSKARGVSKSTLAKKIIAKADKYAAFIGDLVGKRQMLEDKVNAAKTHDDLDAITW